jgi:hypothetical protein
MHGYREAYKIADCTSHSSREFHDVYRDGIVTVSLMQQAPPAITETVNRVIEHTVEKVVPGQTAAVAAPIVTTKTVVMNESDLIPQAIDTISSSLVRLYSSDADNPIFLGLGIVLDDSGTIIVDQGLLGEAADAVVEIPGSLRVRGFVKSRDDVNGIAYLSAGHFEHEGTYHLEACAVCLAKTALRKVSYSRKREERQPCGTRIGDCTPIERWHLINYRDRLIKRCYNTWKPHNRHRWHGPGSKYQSQPSVR